MRKLTLDKTKLKQISGSALTLIPLLFAAVILRPFPWQGHGGVVWFSWAIAVAGAFTSRLRECSFRPRALYPILSIGAAAVMTLYQTAGYFATGAFGLGVPELLRSYRMLGFHPNWRTVLFSTIMMVILITWPRKFKTLSRWLPSGFVGIVTVTGLNLLLNPNPARTVVGELPLPWLPFFNRMPISALSMLLIFAAWEEVPYARVKEIWLRMTRRRGD